MDKFVFQLYLRGFGLVIVFIWNLRATLWGALLRLQPTVYPHLLRHLDSILY